MSEKVESVFPMIPGGKADFDPPIDVEVTFSDSPTIVANGVARVHRQSDGGWWLIQVDGGAVEITPGYTHIEFNPER